MHEPQDRTLSMRVTSGLHLERAAAEKSRRRAAFPWKTSRRKYFRGREFLAGNRDHLIRPH